MLLNRIEGQLRYNKQLIIFANDILLNLTN